jgi:hypothetical protein
MTGENNTEQRLETLPKRRTSGFVWAVAGLFAIATAIGLMLPVVSSREPRGDQCRRNLHKIALAMCNYETKYGRFPPAYTVDKQGRRMHSWRVLVLEFLDPDLHAQYDFNRPWNVPANLAFAKKMTKDGPYRCPSEDIKDPSWTAPYDLNVAEMSFKINDEVQPAPRSGHCGAHASFIDGHEEFLPAWDGTKDAEAQLKALVTINGGEDMSKFHRD